MLHVGRGLAVLVVSICLTGAGMATLLHGLGVWEFRHTQAVLIRVHTNGTDTPEITNATQTPAPRVETMCTHMHDILEGAWRAIPRKSNRCAIWRCGTGCGGVGDRFRGMAGVFVHALFAGRRFAIESTVVAFSQFFEPVVHHDRGGLSVDWNVSCASEGGALTVDTVDGWHMRRCEWDSQPVVYVNTNEWRPFDDRDCIPGERQDRLDELETTAFPLADSLNTSEYRLPRYWMLGCIYRFLFQPTTRMEEVVQEELKRVHEWRGARGPLIGIHVRTGDHSMGVGEGRATPDVAVFMQCAYRRISESAVFYLTTDSEEVKANARTAYADRMLVSDAPPHHVDRSNPAEWNQLMVYRDFVVITRLDGLVASSSGFSVHAGQAAMYPRERFIMIMDC